MMMVRLKMSMMMMIIIIIKMMMVVMVMMTMVMRVMVIIVVRMMMMMMLMVVMAVAMVGMQIGIVLVAMILQLVSRIGYSSGDEYSRCVLYEQDLVFRSHCPLGSLRRSTLAPTRATCRRASPRARAARRSTGGDRL